jgi:NAD(P)-dependent dehydrogenase (short-subunit alcohol dehydrogenase family)
MASEDQFSNLFSCTGRVAVVTGAGGLLGREVCAGLRAAGAEVWAVDLAQVSGESRAARMDITSAQSVEGTLDDVVSTSGELDIFVNCAYPRTADWGTPVGTEDFGSWCDNLQSHLGGYFVSSRAAAERMSHSGGGSIINFASIYGMVGPSWEVYDGTEMTMPSAYSAIKGGVLGMSRFLATYYGPAAVRVNCVSPGGIKAGQPASFVSHYESLTPLGRMGRPDDVVGAVVFLASHAADYVTGQNLVVDGGWTAR